MDGAVQRRIPTDQLFLDLQTALFCALPSAVASCRPHVGLCAGTGVHVQPAAHSPTLVKAQVPWWCDWQLTVGCHYWLVNGFHCL